MRGQHGPTSGYGMVFQTAKFLPIVGSNQAPQSAIFLRIVRGKTLRQARKMQTRLSGGFLLFGVALADLDVQRAAYSARRSRLHHTLAGRNRAGTRGRGGGLSALLARADIGAAPPGGRIASSPRAGDGNGAEIKPAPRAGVGPPPRPVASTVASSVHGRRPATAPAARGLGGARLPRLFLRICRAVPPRAASR
jgi:hypothetical protein